MSSVRLNHAEKNTALFCLTPGGVALARRLQPHLAMSCFTSLALLAEGFTPFQQSFAHALRQAFNQYDQLIVIGATGITVRVLAPVINDKLSDPAVVVLDEQGQFAISLLSGHVGGGNALARQLAELLGGQAVITTATDVNHIAALDVLAEQLDARIDNFRHSVKTVNQMLVSAKKVGIYWDSRLAAEKENYDTRGFIVIDDLNDLPELDALVYVSYQQESVDLAIPVFKLVPRRVVAGIGCRRGVALDLVAEILAIQMSENHFDPLALKMIGSVELKQDETALIQLAQQQHVPFQTFPVSALAEIEHEFPSSEFVRSTIGVGCVSQPVAWLLSHGNLVGRTLKQQGVTMTLGVAQ
ncbi:MAG: cobalt-precorrin 5A hydrolase [Enterobacteriaceae bacterium]|jgi:cobalt-precorrin 5A hydrolase|nr:cobalt-precorrin 5A hydrolase [Enterobacteriaceae bacterium]